MTTKIYIVKPTGRWPEYAYALGMDFDLGGAHTSARLKCVWATNVFERQRKSLTLDKIIQFLQLVLCYGVTFSGA